MTKVNNNNSPNTNWKDYADPVNDPITERNVKILLAALGALFIIGSVVAISLTATGKIGPLTDTFRENVNGVLQETTQNLPSVNYFLYSLAMAGGIGFFIGAGVHSNQRYISCHGISNKDQLRVKTLREMAGALYYDGKRLANLSRLVQKGELTRENVAMIDRHLEHFAPIWKREKENNAKEEVLFRKYVKSIEGLKDNNGVSIDDRRLISDYLSEKDAIKQAEELANQAWQSEAAAAFSSGPLSTNDDDKL